MPPGSDPKGPKSRQQTCRAAARNPARNATWTLNPPDQTLWRRSVSNRRPPACKAGALPLSYAPIIREPTNHTTRPSPAARSTTLQGSHSVVGQGGLEPPTPRLSSVCSNQLSYWPQSSQPTRKTQPKDLSRRAQHPWPKPQDQDNPSQSTPVSRTHFPNRDTRSAPRQAYTHPQHQPASSPAASLIINVCKTTSQFVSQSKPHPGPEPTNTGRHEQASYVVRNPTIPTGRNPSASSDILERR